jgi:Ca-activated chloride channel homolog
MRYLYGEFDGEEFPTQDKLFGFDKLMEFILEHGQQALQAMEQLMKDGEDDAEIVEKLIQEGLLEKDAQGRLKLTPRAVNRMQLKALQEIFQNLRQGLREGHTSSAPGVGGERLEGTRPYQYGDPIHELDIHQTLHSALQRTGLPQKGENGRFRIRFSERDLELHLQEGVTSCSTVVLLDMSGSMMRFGRFYAAKKVAMAMQQLVTSRFPQDTIDFVGFYSGASVIPQAALPLLMPKPVTIFDYSVRMRVPIAKLAQAPQHFTNLHMGLQLARKVLKRRGGENRQILIITDGQPTAHVEGQYVYLIYPPDNRSTMATLKEAHLANQEGCRIATFALIEDYWGMDWVSFVEQMNKLTKGIAFYTSAVELAGCIMESYLTGRKKKTYVGV